MRNLSGRGKTSWHLAQPDKFGRAVLECSFRPSKDTKPLTFRCWERGQHLGIVFFLRPLTWEGGGDLFNSGFQQGSRESRQVREILLNAFKRGTLTRPHHRAILGQPPPPPFLEVFYTGASASSAAYPTLAIGSLDLILPRREGDGPPVIIGQFFNFSSGEGGGKVEFNLQ